MFESWLVGSLACWFSTSLVSSLVCWFPGALVLYFAGSLGDIHHRLVAGCSEALCQTHLYQVTLYMFVGDPEMKKKRRHTSPVVERPALLGHICRCIASSPLPIAQAVREQTTPVLGLEVCGVWIDSRYKQKTARKLPPETETTDPNRLHAQRREEIGR